MAPGDFLMRSDFQDSSLAQPGMTDRSRGLLVGAPASVLCLGRVVRSWSHGLHQMAAGENRPSRTGSILATNGWISTGPKIISFIKKKKARWDPTRLIGDSVNRKVLFLGF